METIEIDKIVIIDKHYKYSMYSYLKVYKYEYL